MQSNKPKKAKLKTPPPIITPIPPRPSIKHHHIKSDVNSEAGETDLTNALLLGNADRVLMYLDNGTSPDIPLLNNQKPLHIATDVGHLNVVKVLVTKGASVDAITLKKQTSLHISVIRGKIDIASFLLDNGANVNSVGR